MPGRQCSFLETRSASVRTLRTRTFCTCTRDHFCHTFSFHSNFSLSLSLSLSLSIYTCIYAIHVYTPTFLVNKLSLLYLKNCLLLLFFFHMHKSVKQFSQLTSRRGPLRKINSQFLFLLFNTISLCN